MFRSRTLPALVAAMLLMAACGGTAATSAPTAAPASQAPASQAPASEAPASEAPASEAPASAAAAGACAPSDATGTVSVKIANFVFDPATVSAKVGDVISWTNTDSVQHTATVKSDETCTTPALATNASAGITFSQAGTYDYFCKIHPQITGKIEVTG